MSAACQNGEKVELPGLTGRCVWTQVIRTWRERLPRREYDQLRKALFCLFLYSDGRGFLLEEIGQQWGHHKSHVARLIRMAEEQLREDFYPGEPPPPADEFAEGLGI